MPTRAGLPRLSQRYRALFEETHDAVALIDLDARFLDCNQRFLELFQLERAEFLQMNAVDLVETSERGAALHMLEQLLEGERPPLYERRYRRKDGSEVICEVNVSMVRDADGNALYCQSILRDITESERQQQRLRELSEELLNARKLESVGLLAGGIAHDFNNLLTAILGNLSLLRLDLADNPGLAHVDAAERATARARALTQQLLTLSKGGAPLREPTCLGELLREVVSERLSASNIAVHFTIDPELHPVDLDRGQFGQVIENLTTNASQAMPDGGSLAVRARNARLDESSSLPLPAGGCVVIEVEDSGEGIAAAHVSRIFDPYFTTREHGSGLGLATSYSIVRKHEGWITVDSEPGRGATFHIVLPASETEIVHGTSTEPVESAERGRVLVLDDEPEVLETVCMLLERLGYEPTRASDGSQAVELYRAAIESGEAFRAVILDLTVRGGMGGRVAMGQLQALDPDVFAIVSSGYAEDAEQARNSDSGFSASLAKPYRIEDLQAAIRGAHDKR